MPVRLIIAYALIAALFLAGTALVLWLRHNMPARAHARGRKLREDRDKLAAAARK